jgi:hypothetical protein
MSRVRSFPSTGSALLAALVVVGSANAQTSPKTWDQIQAAVTEHKDEFDYLLGDWEFTSISLEYGQGHGVWSAVQLDEGQILDEYRVLGDSGETVYVTTTLRNYNGVQDRWELISADAGTGLQDSGTGRWMGNEMHIEQRFGVAGGNPSLWRIRYFNIRPDSFQWTADRSPDDGKTWVRNYLQIAARRIGPARTMGPIAAPRP